MIEVARGVFRSTKHLPGCKKNTRGGAEYHFCDTSSAFLSRACAWQARAWMLTHLCMIAGAACCGRGAGEGILW